MTAFTNLLDASDREIAYAIRRIQKDYGDTVSVDSKAKILLKFGRNPNVQDATTGYTIWYTGQDDAHETYVAANTNSIDTLSCANASDTGSTKELTIEGHTESGGNKTFVVQTATPDGQNKVTLSTALNRVDKVYNSGTADLVGEVYVYEDTSLTSGKPTDTTKIHLTIPAGTNESRKAAASVSSEDYWIITSFRGSLLERATSFADVSLQIRENGKVFREVEDVASSSSDTGIFEFKPYIIVPKNADVRLIGISDSNTGRDVSGTIQGYIAKIVT